MTDRIPDVTRYYRNTGVVSLGTFRALLERYKALEQERDEARRQSDRFCNKYLAALSRAEAAEAKLAEAMKVIEPFADVAEWGIGNSESDDDIFRPIGGRVAVAEPIRVGHLRAARKFLKENGNG